MMDFEDNTITGGELGDLGRGALGSHLQSEVKGWQPQISQVALWPSDHPELLVVCDPGRDSVKTSVT